MVDVEGAGDVVELDVAAGLDVDAGLVVDAVEPTGGLAAFVVDGVATEPASTGNF